MAEFDDFLYYLSNGIDDVTDGLLELVTELGYNPDQRFRITCDCDLQFNVEALAADDNSTDSVYPINDLFIVSGPHCFPNNKAIEWIVRNELNR